MRIKLTLTNAGGVSEDVMVTADDTATVSDLAAALFRTDPRRQGAPVPPALTLVVNDVEAGQRTLPADRVLSTAGLRSGSSVALATESARFTDGGQTSVGTLTVLSGPDAGSSFPLHSGSNVLGRDRSADIRLTDPMVSKFHARVNVTDIVEVVDTNSSNGVLVRGDRVQRVVVRPEDIVSVGDTSVSVSVHTNAAVVANAASEIAFNRSPRLDPVFEGPELDAPEPPSPPQGGRFPLVPLVAPVLMGCIMFLITRNATSVLFVALSPLMLVGNFVENRLTGKRAHRQAVEHFRARLVELADRIDYVQTQERAGRLAEHPSTVDTGAAVWSLTPMTWTRRPAHRSFLELRLGLGTLPSRITVKEPSLQNVAPDLIAELRAVTEPRATVSGVPVVASLRTGGALGVAGPDGVALPVAAAAVVQLVGLHSPAEVVVASVASARSARGWESLKWLPHTTSEHSPLEGAHLAVTGTSCTELVSQLERLVEERREAAGSREAPPPIPAVVLVVFDDAPIERSRLVSLADTGAAAGVHVVWVAPSVDRLPAACRTYVAVGPDGAQAEVGYVDSGHSVPVAVERCESTDLHRVAVRLAPVVDAGAPIDDEKNLPSYIAFLQMAGMPLADEPEWVVDRWREAGSIVPRDGTWLPRRRKDYPLRGLVGQGATEPFTIDLRADGPHALVGGTTGSGKSEFLQSWILGMAAAQGPDRITFLLIDYKGGSAFSECTKLPHTVGLVTDLSPRLVRRALTSLDAELRYRERLLNRKNKIKDLVSLERTGDPEAPPSLVIVVDEFAALVQEVPEFIDGVVNVAQRGRSLGLHLVLATQRPAGVIKDNLRANTNLRIALRMNDEADAADVIGSTQPAAFDPALRGRAIAKTGPGRLTPFQTGYLGGYTSNEPPKPSIAVYDLVFGAPSLRVDPADDVEGEQPDLGATDLERVVANIKAAAALADVPAPRKPWLPELSPVYELAKLPTKRRDDELVFGVRDDPDEQDQPAASFDPEGNVAIYGTGGSGKSTALRSLAIAAGLSVRGGPVHVYGLDFGSRGLAVLESLPHVGSIIPGDDNERVARLLNHLRALIDERSSRYSAQNADSIASYRESAHQPNEPRILLLVDGMAAFRQAYEVSDRSRLFDTFLSIASDGRGVGVHIAVTADRPAAIPSSLGSSIQQRLVLRLTSEMDLAMLGVPADGFALDSPPGRGYLGEHEVQVAVFGGSPVGSVQSSEIDKLVVSMQRAGVSPAPSIQRLTERVGLFELPEAVAGSPTIGVADASLTAIGFTPGTTFVVSGPPGSGRTSTMGTLALSLRRWRPNHRLAYFGLGRSPLPGLIDWTWSASGAEECAALAGKLVSELTTPSDTDAPTALFIESIPDFLNGDADYALQELLKVAKTMSVSVYVDGETTGLNGSWPLLQAVKSGRHGLALQPDQMDGDAVFRTPFPRIDRREFPPGRALYVRAGKVQRLQVALPE